MEFFISTLCLFGSIGAPDSQPLKSEKVAEKPKLKLYVSARCGYCKKVLRYLNANHIDIEIVNVNDGDNRKILKMKGGKTMVPCLFIDDKPLYESDDIITYLKKHN